MRVKLTNMASQSTYYVYRAGLEYEVKITPDGREALRYYNYDQFRSTVVITDSAQAITDRFHYARGYVLHSIGDSDTPFQFVGAYGIQTDPNGLINMRARYYNPVTKSFISQDPSGFDGGLNWYLYANGNPFTYIDQNGEFPVIPILIAAAISGVIDMTITTATDIHNDNFNWESTGAAFLRGFIVGSIAAIATPLSGSVIRSIPSFLNNAGRLTSSGIVARNTLSIGISTAGSGIGQVSYNQLMGRNWDDQLYQAMAFGAIGNSVAYITSRVPKWGNSLFQMNNFGPKTLSTSLTSQNSRYLYNSILDIIGCFWRTEFWIQCVY